MPDGNGSPCILVVDDNDAGRYATARLLRGAKFEIIEAATGATALAQVEAHQPELVVLDVNLPDMNGFEVCRKIKTAPSTAATLVLHLSATYVDSGSKVAGLVGGADAYLTQPVSADELVATVNALLRIGRAEEEARCRAEEACLARQELEHLLAALREKNQTLEALFRASPLAVVALNADSHVTAWNNAAEQMFGWPEQEVLGRKLPTFSDELRDSDQQHPEELACRGKVLVNVEAVRKRKNGSRFPVSLSAAPLLDSDGRVQGSIIVASDETGRKLAEEELRRHEQLVASGRMASALAHEINNPLSAVVNFLYLLGIRTDLVPEVREMLHHIDREVSRISEITTQVLSSHRQSPDAMQFNIAEMLDAALSLYIVRLRENSIEVQREFDTTATVVLPPGEIRQVLSNVVANAIEAMPKGGVLKVRIRNGRNSQGVTGVRVTIADSGSGIPAEVRARIFEPFFTTKGEKGTGLGLWVVRGILAKHGASIRLRSSTAFARKGTTFSIFLPKSAIPGSREAA